MKTNSQTSLTQIPPSSEAQNYNVPSGSEQEPVKVPASGSAQNEEDIYESYYNNRFD
jgi:hypothetical protein